MSCRQPSLSGALRGELTPPKRLDRLRAPALLAALLLCAQFPVYAAINPATSASPETPVGQWKTIDDVTGQVKSIVQIREQNGVLYGTVVDVFNPPAPNPLCIHCPGAFKDRPVVGLQILWGLRKSGADKSGAVWTGGQILDPENGKIYRCNLTLADHGQTLRLRGYIGFSLFGRTQRWQRVAGP
jgi:uncharacterized protein (DUF2147 family)